MRLVCDFLSINHKTGSAVRKDALSIKIKINQSVPPAWPEGLVLFYSARE